MGNYSVLLVNNTVWNKEVKRRSQEWTKNVRQWLDTTGFPKLIVGFENLKNNTYTELKKILDFLEYSYSEDDVLCAVRSHDVENFHRKYTKEIYPYSPEQQTFVRNQIELVHNDLLKHNISLL